MSDLTELIPFLKMYPNWVKWVAIGWLFFTVALIALLVVLHPGRPAETELKIDAFRVASPRTEDCLLLEVVARNPLSQTVQLVEMNLSFFGKEKPKGGLQSLSQISTTYALADGADANTLITGAETDSVRYKTNISYPYAGQNYAEVTIPLSQNIMKDASDRFLIRLEADRLPDSGHKHIEAVIRYNGVLLTKPHLLTIE